MGRPHVPNHNAFESLAFSDRRFRITTDDPVSRPGKVNRPDNILVKMTMSCRRRTMVKFPPLLILLGSTLCGRGESFSSTFAMRGRLSIRFGESRRVGIFRPALAKTRLQMLVEPIATLLVAADSAATLGDIVNQTPDALGATPDIAGSAANIAGSAANLAETAQTSIGESLDSIGNLWGSVVDSVTSLKDQVDDIGANAISPFQQIGEGVTGTLNGAFDSAKDEATGAVEGAQVQFGETMMKNIGYPLQDALGRLFSKFGTSPEQLLEEEQSWTNGVQQTIRGVEKVATPSTSFYVENAAILPLWIGMIGFPEKPLTKAVMSTYTPVVIAAIVYMWLTYECFQNPVSLTGFASGITNLGGLTTGFGEEVSVAAAWSHFLAEDLFIGRWVYLDGQKNGIFTKHSLTLCYLFGPVGFLSHLLTRTAFSVVKPGVQDIMEAGAAPRSKSQSKAAPSASQQTPPRSSRKEPAMASTGQPSMTSTVPSTASLKGEAKQAIANAMREAEDILDEARSAGAAQAASILEAAETEALDILKGAEVERLALQKASQGDSVSGKKMEPAGGKTLSKESNSPAKNQPPSPPPSGAAGPP